MELFQRLRNKPLAYFLFVDDVWHLWTYGLYALPIPYAVLLDSHKSQARTPTLSRHNWVPWRHHHDWWRLPGHGPLHQAYRKALVSTQRLVTSGIYEQSHPVRPVCEGKAYLCWRRQQRENIKSPWKQPGYGEALVERELKKVDGKGRDDLLQHNKGKRQTTRLPLVLSCSRALPNIRDSS